MTTNIRTNYPTGKRAITQTVTTTGVTSNIPTIFKNTPTTISGTTFGSSTGMKVTHPISVSTKSGAHLVSQHVATKEIPGTILEASQPYSGPILEGQKTQVPLNQRKFYLANLFR